MTTLEMKNAKKTKSMALIGTVLFHVVLIAYMIHVSSGEESGILEFMKSLWPAGQNATTPVV